MQKASLLTRFRFSYTYALVGVLVRKLRARPRNTHEAAFASARHA